MSPPFAAVEEIFFNALEHEDLPGRAAYLDEVCGRDTPLRSQVERLLAAEPKVDRFLEEPAAPHSFALDVGPLDDLGTMIGPYRRLEQIGVGGMGVVYLAEQTAPVRRRVALKIIKPGMDTKQVVARFEAERQALAMMDHPNIARVLDAGATDIGRPYFVMELVEGVPITLFCDREHLTIRQRLEVFVVVCQAVQHAHQKGIIHRDLKPSNIVATRIDGAIVPKVIDFGVAKAVSGHLTDETLDTCAVQLVGTPLYMSPEQAAWTSADIDTRTDIYSLGVVLYELLTGSTAFDPDGIRGAGFDEVRRVVLEHEPTRPSTRLGARGMQLESIAANRQADPRRLPLALRGDLDWIVMKAIDKDRRRRYETAAAFADDVLRYLTDKPVKARPPSAWYGFTKYARRHRVPLTTTALVALALIAGTVVSVWQAVRATRAERDTAAALAAARAQGRLVERHLYAARLRQAGEALDQEQAERAQEILDALRPETGEPDPRGFAWSYLWQSARHELGLLGAHGADISALALSPNSRLLATGDDLGMIHLRDVATEQLRAQLPGHAHTIKALAFSADGRLLASADEDQSAPPEATAEDLRIWDVAGGRQIAVLATAGKLYQALSFAPSGRRLVAVWIKPKDASYHADLFDLAAETNLVLVRTQDLARPEYDLASAHLAAALPQGTLSVLDAETLAPRWSVSAAEGGLRWPTLSQDGRSLAAQDGRHAVVFDAATGKERVRVGIERPERAPSYLQLSPDGTKLLVWYNPVSVTLFDLPLKSGGVPREMPLPVPGQHRSLKAAFARDGTKVAINSLRSEGGQGPVLAFDTTNGQVVAGYPGLRVPNSHFAFSGDARVLFINGGSALYRWALEGPRDERRDVLPGHADEAWSVAFSPGGDVLATGSDDDEGEHQTIKLWDTRTGRLLLGWYGGVGTVAALAFSPDGKSLVSAHLADDDPNQVRLWDAATGCCIAMMQGHVGRVRTVAYRPGGNLIASAGDDGKVRLWTATGEYVNTLNEHSNKVRDVAFSPDGQTLASVGNDDTVRLWDVASGQERSSLRHSALLTAVAFSPDGRMVAATDEVGTILLWEPDAGTVPPRHLHSDEGELRSLSFTPNGSALATAGAAGIVRLWDPLTGQELLALKGHKFQVNGLAFSPDGLTLASCSHDGVVRLWRSGTLPR